MGVLTFILALVLWVIYHKIFDVTYFDFGSAFLKEVVVCLLIAYLIVHGVAGKLGIGTTDLTAVLLSNPRLLQ